MKHLRTCKVLQYRAFCVLHITATNLPDTILKKPDNGPHALPTVVLTSQLHVVIVFVLQCKLIVGKFVVQLKVILSLIK